MKRLQACIITCGLVYGTLHAEINEGGVSQEQIPGDSDKPYKITAYGDSIRKAKFDDKRVPKEGVRYSQMGIEGSLGIYKNITCGETAYISADFSDTQIKWKENPYFSQSHFHTLSLAVGGSTERACGWKIWGEVDLNIDLDHQEISQFSTYDFFLWGRYLYSDSIGLHVGFLAETGMKIDRIYPILGFDWQATKKIKINAVFPLNISAVYLIDNHFSVAVAGRFFNSRFRVSKSEPLSRGLVSYRSSGVEVAANYTNNSSFEGNLHIGYDIGGNLKIADRRYADRHRYKFKAAPYYGGELVAKF